MCNSSTFLLLTFWYTRNDFLVHLYIFFFTFDRIPFIVLFCWPPMYTTIWFCLLGSNDLMHKICVNNCLLLNIRHKISDSLYHYCYYDCIHIVEPWEWDSLLNQITSKKKTKKMPITMILFWYTLHKIEYFKCKRVR